MADSPQQLDITAPEFPVEIEIDLRRDVLYIHVDGYTPLRICRMPGRPKILVRAANHNDALKVEEAIKFAIGNL